MTRVHVVPHCRRLTFNKNKCPFAGQRSARLVVANDVAVLSECCETCVRLLGGSVVTPEVFLGIRNGPCLTFFPAVSSVKREIWVSDMFRAAKPEIARIVDAASLSDASRWSIIASAAEFDAVRRANKLAKSCVIGLATAVEVKNIRAAMPAHANHVFELPEFLAYASKLDKARSRNGVQ